MAAASYDASTGLPDLPPGFELVALREVGDAFAHACSIAADAGAGTLVWSRRATMAEFAVVLEPDEPLAQARRAFFACMNAIGDTLAARMPPEKPLEFGWPGTVLVDRGNGQAYHRAEDEPARDLVLGDARRPGEAAAADEP
ncbi:MAG: biotin/lipoate--protein ligase family protein, partial [Alphaproteobacteria bacterium]